MSNITVSFILSKIKWSEQERERAQEREMESLKYIKKKKYKKCLHGSCCCCGLWGSSDEEKRSMSCSSGCHKHRWGKRNIVALFCREGRGEGRKMSAQIVNEARGRRLKRQIRFRCKEIYCITSMKESERGRGTEEGVCVSSHLCVCVCGGVSIHIFSQCLSSLLVE